MPHHAGPTGAGCSQIRLRNLCRTQRLGAKWRRVQGGDAETPSLLAGAARRRGADCDRSRIIGSHRADSRGTEGKWEQAARALGGC